MPSPAADYYLDAGGSDLNSGSQSSPWQTIDKVNATNFTAGDRIFFQGGQTFSGKLYFDVNDTGTAANPIVVTSYGTGRATINGGSSDGFYAYNTAGLSISNLNFVAASGFSSTGHGICFYTDLPGDVKLPHIYIDSVEIQGFRDGINIGAWNGVSGFKNVRITNAIVHDNWDQNIVTYGPNDYVVDSIYIAHCQAYDSSGDPNQQSRSSGNGIVLGSVNGATIEHCIAYNNGWLCSASSGPCGIWCYESNAVTIQFNEAWHNHGITVDGDGFDLDGDTQNSVIQYNYSHDNDASGFLICEYSGATNVNANNVVRYNVSQDDCRAHAYGAIEFYNAGVGLSNCEVYNNTIYVTPASYGMPTAVNVYSPTADVHFRNNILITTGGAPLVTINAPQAGLLFDHNCYWTSGGAFAIQDRGTTYSDLASWRAATGQEPAVLLNADPQLASPGGGGTIGNADNLGSLTAYKLLAGSALIDAGLNLNSIAGNSDSLDYWGSATPQGAGYDIGANEFVVAVSPPPANHAPVFTSAAFAFPNPANPGDAIAFTVTASDADGDPLTYTWSFGDGGSASGASATHVYAAPGSYSATATVTDGQGGSATSSVTVVVLAPVQSDPPPANGNGNGNGNNDPVAAPGTTTPDATVTLGRSFRIKLPVPASLAQVKKLTTTAANVPRGIRVAGGYISARARTAGTFTFTIQYRGKLMTLHGAGRRTMTVVQETLPFTLAVNP